MPKPVTLQKAIPNATEVSTFAPPPNEATDLVPGERIYDFLVLREIGRGGIAAVYLAQDLSLQRKVALKVSKVSGEEGRTLAQLDHENIVRVFSDTFDPETHTRVTCMQYVSGASLGKALRQFEQTKGVSGLELLGAVRKLSVEKDDGETTSQLSNTELSHLEGFELLYWIGVGLARALEHAHEKGVVHLDVKPDNVLIGSNGTLYLADFNVSSLEGSVQSGSPATFGGTPEYMSPEQAAAIQSWTDEDFQKITFKSDIYSLGKVLNELASILLPPKDLALIGQFDLRWDDLGPAAHFGALMKRTTETDPDARPDATDLVSEFESGLQSARLYRSRLSRRRPRFGSEWSLVAGTLPGVLTAVLFCAIGQLNYGILSPNQRLESVAILYILMPLLLGVYGYFIAQLIGRLRRSSRSLGDLTVSRLQSFHLRQKVIRTPFMITSLTFLIWALAAGSQRVAYFPRSELLLPTLTIFLFAPVSFLMVAIGFSKSVRWAVESALPPLWAGQLDCVDVARSDLTKLQLAVNVYRRLAVFLPLLFATGLTLVSRNDQSFDGMMVSRVRCIEFMFLAAYQILATEKVTKGLERVIAVLDAAKPHQKAH